MESLTSHYLNIMSHYSSAQSVVVMITLHDVSRFFFFNNAAVADATGILKHHRVTKAACMNKHNLNMYQALSKLVQNDLMVAGVITFAAFWTTNHVMLCNRLTVCQEEKLTYSN